MDDDPLFRGQKKNATPYVHLASLPGNVVSTGTKGDFEVHPDPLILDWASEMGVKLTIGSDSHRPHSVGQFFETIQPMLRDKGFKDLHYFRGRKRLRIDMPTWD
jgi:histidinol phosphatase-like PHP family hydrolase